MTLRQRELTVGNRRVASLEALQRLPTRGIADVYDGQFVIVDSVDYAEMVGAKNYVALPDQSVEWSAPSSGYVSLDGSQYIQAEANKTHFSMIGQQGNSFAFWFRLEDESDCTLFHIPTLSSTGTGNGQNPYGIRGLSLNAGRPTDIHPSNFSIPGNPGNQFNLYLNFDFTFKYLHSSGVLLPASGQLSRQTGYAVEPGRWYHAAVSLNNSTRMITVYLDGAQILQLDLIYNPEVSNALETLNISQSDVDHVHFNGESTIINHKIILGAHLDEDGNYGGFLNGSLDEVFYYNRELTAPEIRNNFYNNGVHEVGKISLSDCLHYWSLGDSLPVPTETNTLRIDNYQNAVYMETSEDTQVWREETFDTQIVVRPLGDSPADGFAETRSFVTLASSYRGTGFSPGSDAGFSVLTSNSTSSAWSAYDLWEKGTIVIPFFVDSSVLDAASNGSGKYHLLNIGYESMSPVFRNGIQIFVERRSSDDLSLVVEIIDTDRNVWQLRGANKVEDVSWNMCVVSFNFSDENINERASLYMNGRVSDVLYGAHKEGRYVKTSTDALTFRRISLGGLAYEHTGQIKYKEPFYGKIDQVIISSEGDPSDHGANNLITEDSPSLATNSLLSQWKFTSEDSLGISGVYGPTNSVSNSVYPGTPDYISGPDSFGLDLFGKGVGTSDLTSLSASEGHSGTSLPTPRSVPSNWGTYFFDEDRKDFSEEYSNEPDYGFIVVRPNDRAADQAGRWVSVISYSVWTAYLFGSSEADLRLEEGQLPNVEEGDLAVFNRNGKIVPIEPIEQWLSPTYFANARPLPDSTGFKGQRCYDGSYMYECVATNTWVRYQVVNSWE